MAKEHSFFIPDIDKLVDVKGLIRYLGDKISIANVCIFCNGKGKALHTTEAVKAHMISKGHCKIPYEDGDEEELEEFYDFDQGWEDEQDVEEDEEQVGQVHLTEDETQLVLPSGIKVGHRSFNRYWKQNIKPTTIIPGSRNDPDMVARLQGKYKLLGYSTPAQFSVAIARQNQMVLMERKQQSKLVQKHHQQFSLKVGIRGNNQKHFRDPTGMLQ